MTRSTLCLVIVLAIALPAATAIAQATAATLIVAQDGRGGHRDCDAETPTPYTTVAAAIAAAATHDVVKVCPGTYQEQLEIRKPLTLRGEPGVILKPSEMVANTTSLTTGNALATVIVVDGTTGVTIEGLTIDGADNGLTSCPPETLPDLFGVYYRNASGTLRDSAVRNFRLADPACPAGTGIFVQSAGGRSIVIIEGNSIHSFQRNGITANETGTDVWIRRTVVTGLGPTTGAVQNGIQLAFGATGLIADNVVTQTLWANCVSLANCPSNASNVLIGSGSSGVRVMRNVLGSSQAGVNVFGQGNRMQGNLIFDTRVLDGIFVDGDENVIEGNEIARSDESGIFTAGNNNRVVNNRINDAPIGLLDDGAGNRFLNNIMLNTPVPGPAAP